MGVKTCDPSLGLRSFNRLREGFIVGQGSDSWIHHHAKLEDWRDAIFGLAVGSKGLSE